LEEHLEHRLPIGYHKTRNSWLNAVLLATLILTGMGLASAAYLGVFTRFHADDFCVAGAVNTHGFWGAQEYWYQGWSGRYAFYLIGSLAALAGPGAAAVLPPLTILVWLAGLAWVAYQLGEWLGWHYPVFDSLLIAASVLLAVLATIPNLFQSAIWETGLLTYTLPLVLLTWGVGWILRLTLKARQAPAWPFIGLHALLAFVAGGLSETYLALQLAGFVLVFGVVLLLGRPRLKSMLLPLATAWVFGSLLALVVMFTAPGNAVRQAGLPETPGLARIISFSIRNAAHIAGKYVLWTPLAAVTSFLIPLIIGWTRRSHPLTRRLLQNLTRRSLLQQPWMKWLIIIPASGFLLMAAVCAPTVFAMNAYPDDRVIIIPQFILVVTISAFAYLAGWLLKQVNRLAPRLHAVNGLVAMAVVVTLLAGAASIQFTNDMVTRAHAARQYINTWDERDAQLQSAAGGGIRQVEVISLESRSGLMELGLSGDDWVNRCMAEYYGLEVISGR
jgi:hypothetical protein